jgi:hypothetical protein
VRLSRLRAAVVAAIIASPAAAQTVVIAGAAGEAASATGAGVTATLGTAALAPALTSLSPLALGFTAITPISPIPTVIPAAAVAVPAIVPVSISAAPQAKLALVHALAPAPAAEMPGRLDALYAGGAAKKGADADPVAGDPLQINSVASFLADHRERAAAAKHAPAGRKLRFAGIGGRDVYNPTAPFKARFRGREVEVMAARVEPRKSEVSEAVFFEKVRGRWRPLDGAPVFKLQDPFVFKVDGELIFGGVETFPRDGGGTGYRTVFYRGRSLSELTRFAQGPDGMKDIRLAPLPDGRLLLVTRPQGVVGGRGKIAVTTIDGLSSLGPEAIARAAVLDNLFAADEWGGANELHALPGGLIGVLGHIAKYDEKGDRHYYPMVFTLDPATGRRSPLKILLERSQLPAGPAKSPDLADVLFSGGLVRRGDGTAVLYVGAGDVEVHRIVIPDPFAP